MAEIHLQRKRKNLWWLWLLLILIVLAVVYYLYTNNYFDQQDRTVLLNQLSDVISSEEIVNLS